jgi:WD40 repeat protein
MPDGTLISEIKVFEVGKGISVNLQGALSPDGREFVAWIGDGAYAIDVRTGSRRRLLRADGRNLPNIHRWAFSRDGKLLVTAPRSGEVIIFDWRSRREIKSKRLHSAQINRIQFSPDGKTLATAGADMLIKLTDVESMAEIASFADHVGDVTNLDYSPDGRWLASCGDDSRVLVWDIANRSVRARFVGHVWNVWSISFSTDGAHLLTGGIDESVRIWDVRRKLSDGFGITLGRNTCSGAALSPDGRTLAAATRYGFIWLFDTETGQDRARILGGPWGGAPFAFADEGRSLITIGAPGVSYGTAVSWDLSTMRPTTLFDTGIARPEGFTDLTTLSGGFGDRGRVLALMNTDRVEVWNVTARARLHSLAPGSEVWSVAVSPDGVLVAAGCHDNLVHVWRTASGEEIARLEGHTKRVTAMAFSPDSHILATGSADRTVRLWDVASWGERGTLGGHRGEVSALDFSPDGSRLAAGAADGTIRIWGVDDPSEIVSIKEQQHAITALAFSSDGSELAISAGRSVRIWRTRAAMTPAQAHPFGNSEIFTLEPLPNFGCEAGPNRSVPGSVDGRRLAIVNSSDRSVEFIFVDSDGRPHTVELVRVGESVEAICREGDVWIVVDDTGVCRGRWQMGVDNAFILIR